jgi:exodeoxyribonuclease-5
MIVRREFEPDNSLAEISHPVHLSEEQEAAVSSLSDGIRRGDRQQTLGGYAGTGKTTLIRVLHRRHPGLLVVAPTGKAAAVLRRKGIPARTIHSTIYWAEDEPYGGVSFHLKDELPEDAGGFICDEASMVDARAYRDLMSFGVPVVFVGDHGQLEPVGDNPNLMHSPDYRLEKIHRHAGEIPRFAEWLRLGRPAREFTPRDDKVALLPFDQVSCEEVLAADQVICAFNRTRVASNARIRELLGRRDRVEVGEKVMCLRNDHEIGLHNGQQGVVTRVGWHRGHPVIDFEAYHDMTFGGLIIDPDQLGKQDGNSRDRSSVLHPFDYAYVITAHKAQGDEWPHVLVFEQVCKRWDHGRWAYTCASRARDRLTWVMEGGHS